MTNKFVAVLRLLRVKQWYKNVLMFFGIFFGGQLFTISIYPQVLLGFLLISLMSSMNYIQNDIRDIEKDKLHEEKRKKRPLANGDLSKTTAWVIFIILAGIEIYFIIFYYYDLFSLLLLAVYLNGMLYNYVFKRVAFADIIALSMIYIWRTIAGCIIIDIMISPWLFVIVFLTAAFLASAKRIADFEYLGEENAIKHKKVYDKYSKDLLRQIIIIIATSLFLSYTLYCVFGPKEEDTSIISKENSSILLYSMPVALYIVIRFLYLMYAKPEIARDASKIIKDRGLLIGGALLAVILAIALYLGSGSFEVFIATIFL